MPQYMSLAGSFVERPICQHTWVDDRVVTIDLYDYNPKLFQQLVRDAFLRKQEREIAAKIPGFGAARVATDAVRSFTASNKHASEGTHIAVALASNSVWCKDRLAEAGYTLDNTLCDLCGEAEDSLHHRLWECTNQQVTIARGATVKQYTFDTVRKEERNSILCCHALLPHFADNMPLPAGPRWLWGTDEIKGCDGLGDAIDTFVGPTLMDGHCSRTRIKGCDRASWAVVNVDTQAAPVKWLVGTVPVAFPQTPQAAEYFAAMYAALYGDKDNVVYGDCENVIRTFNKSPGGGANTDDRYAGNFHLSWQWVLGKQDNADGDWKTNRVLSEGAQGSGAPFNLQGTIQPQGYVESLNFTVQDATQSQGYVESLSCTGQESVWFSGLATADKHRHAANGPQDQPQADDNSTVKLIPEFV